MEQKKKFIVGLRIIKSVIAIMLSALFMRYVLKDTPFFACIGAVVAVERTISHSLRAAIIRNVGTIVGGVTGVIFAMLSQNIFILSLGLIPLILINNRLNKKDSIVPGAIVYFAVVYLNTVDTAFDYGFRRILGTLIGTVIGLLVNYLLFRPKDDTTPITKV